MQPRNRIFTPRDELIVPKIRERHAPRARPRAGIGGRLRWGLVDRLGRERAGGEQHNLILDTFLNLLGTRNSHTLVTFSSATVLMSHCAVGTGSTEPAVTDTALDAEVQRTNRTTSATVENVGTGEYEWTITWEFDFNEANGNLTEWGIASGASADLLVRELFRDELGEPVTVTKTSDYKLRLTYTLTVTLSPMELTPGSFVIDGIGTINGNYLFSGSTRSADLHVWSLIARGSVTTNISTSFIAIGGLATTALTGPTSNVTIAQNMEASTFTASAFVEGVWERSVDAAFSTAKGNGTIATIGVAMGGPTQTDRVIGFGFVVDLADRFTKDDEHILTINDIARFTWGRST